MAKKTVASTKKPAPKTPARRKTTRAVTASPTVSAPPSTPLRNPRSRLWIMGGIAVLALGVAAYVLKGLAIAALVNGRPVSRIAVIKQLEKLDGAQVLDSLVTQALIDEAASKQRIVINPGDIDAEMAKLEEQIKGQGRDLDELLAMQGMTREVLKKQIALQKTVEKLSGSDAITVGAAEVKEFVASNSAFFPKTLSAAEINTQAAAQLKSQKAQTLIQAFIDQLHQSAKIQYFVNYQ